MDVDINMDMVMDTDMDQPSLRKMMVQVSEHLTQLLCHVFSLHSSTEEQHGLFNTVSHYVPKLKQVGHLCAERSTIA